MDTNIVEFSDMTEYTNLVIELDDRYGGPEKKNPSRSNGEYALRYILGFMSTHRGCICEDLAKYEQKRNPAIRRKLRSITDDVRKFIKNNLIPTKLALEDGIIQRSNKHIQKYSLTPIGILYAIHIFGHQKSFLDALAKEYRDILPMVLGKLDHLRGVFDNKLSEVMNLETISSGQDQLIPSSTSPGYVPFSLHNYADYIDDMKSFEQLPSEERINVLNGIEWKIRADQISLLIYNTILVNLDAYLLSGIGIHLTRNFQRQTKIRELRNKIINSDPEIKRWYRGLVSRALEAYTERRKNLQEMMVWTR